jgi:hypothetical protein
MVEIDIDVTVGGVMAVPVTSTVVDVTPFPGSGNLAGWSLRDASSAVPNEVSGLVVAPGAGATIAQLAALPAGEYAVNWTVGLQGAAAAADANNFELFDTAGNVLASVNPGAAGDYPQAPVTLTVAAGQTIGVKAIGAGTAGVTYSADISIDPTAFPETVVELQDGGSIIGEVSFQSERASTQWFGTQGPYLNAGVKLHVVSGAVVGVIYVVPSRP